MLLKKVKTLLITASAFTILLSSSAFSTTAYATGNVSHSIPSQSTNVTTKSTVDLKKLQHYLKRLFNAGLTEDNIKGINTNKAITKYGAIIGSVDPNTLLQLTEQVLIFPVCKQGSTGPAVRYIQYRLGVTIGKNFETITTSKVKAFQELKSIASDGIVSSITWAKLMH
jgi:N-acetylmuramoyl-L-alanine amidase